MIKRLLCLQSTSLLENYGGIEYYLHDFLSRLSEIVGEENVKSLVPVRRKSRVEFEHDYELEAVEQSSSAWLGRIQNRLPWALFFRALRKSRTFKPTILICGHVSLAPLAWVLSKILGCPYYVCVYGVESWGKMWVQDRLALKKADKIISISHWTKGILVKQGFRSSQISIVHPQMHPSFEKKRISQDDSTANKPFTLLTISRLSAQEKYKGQDHVFYALARLIAEGHPRTFKYIVLGDGDDESRLRELSVVLGLESVVEFRPPVKSRVQLEKAYQEADVYIMPSRFGFWDGKWKGEGFGIVYVEAAAFGVPSIAYKCGGVTDIVQDGKSGFLVEADNISELSAKIGQLSLDRELVSQTGAYAQAHCREAFTSDPVRAQLKEIFF